MRLNLVLQNHLFSCHSIATFSRSDRAKSGQFGRFFAAGTPLLRLTKPLILANNHKASLKSWRSVQRRMGFRRASFLKIGTILPPRAPPPLSTYFYCHVHLLPPTFTCPACWTACTTAGRLRLCACGERRRAGAPPSRPPIPSNSGRDPRRQEIEPPHRQLPDSGPCCFPTAFWRGFRTARRSIPARTSPGRLPAGTRGRSSVHPLCRPDTSSPLSGARPG